MLARVHIGLEPTVTQFSHLIKVKGWHASYIRGPNTFQYEKEGGTTFICFWNEDAQADLW